MLKIDPAKVAIYIRWSTEDQGQGHTLEIQRESCRYYCLSQGWQPRDALTFIDEGYSGSNLERPALRRLREAVRESQVDCVVVYKLDRLSRNVRELLNLVLDEWEERCCVRSTQEPVDTTTDAGRMFFTMLGSFADFERSAIKSRTWSGKRKNAEQGRNPGMAYPYGYAKSETGGWMLVEDEAAVVRRIFADYIQGGSCRHIACALNGDGLRTRSGRLWDDTDISRLLRNPLYCGRLVYNRRDYARRARLGRVALKDPSEVIAREGAAPAIVPPDVWDAAERIRAERPRVDRPGAARALASPHLLAGLLKCGGCGRSWISVTGGRQGERFYTCAGARSGGEAACASSAVKAEMLEQWVLDVVREAWRTNPPFRPELITGPALDAVRELEGRARLLRQRLISAEAAQKRLKLDYKAGRLPADAFAELQAEMRSEQAELLAALERMESECRSRTTTPADIARAESVYATINLWALLEPADLQKLLRLLVRQIRISRPKGSRELVLHLDWRVPEPAAAGA